jgi:hypothetical protein
MYRSQLGLIVSNVFNAKHIQFILFGRTLQHKPAAA